MKFGLSLSPHQWWKETKQLDMCIQKAEELGYDAIFVPDHYDLPPPSNLPHPLLVDCWTTLSYIAAKTSTIKIGSLVSPVPRWIPSQLAKVIASVDILSNGRVIAGLGAGYTGDEFINYSPTGVFAEPKIRFEMFLEGVEVIIKLWTMESVTFKGKYYTLNNASLFPKPVQKPRPPIWSGGGRSRLLKATTRCFEGWAPTIFDVPTEFGTIPILPPEEYKVRVERIRGYLRNFGRDESSFTFAVLGSIDVNAEYIDRYKSAGCQYYIADVLPPGKPYPDPEQSVKKVEKFANEIISSF
ncbi:MAG: LLM class flavin-dependent oxidoreductase [Candidatus Bathyarchaeia archaeon]